MYYLRRRKELDSSTNRLHKYTQSKVEERKL